MTVSDNCLDSANPSPARSKGPGNYCPNPDSQVYVSLIFVLFSFVGTAKIVILFPKVPIYSHLDLTLVHISDMLQEVQKLLERRRKDQGYMTTLE